MGYPLPIQRRRRRRRRTILLIATLVVVVLAALILRFVTQRQAVSDYLEAAREVAFTYAGLGVRANTLVAGLEGADRSSLLEVLTNTAAEANEASDTYHAFAVPSDAKTQDGFLSVAVESWRTGLVGFDEGVKAVLEDPSDPIGIQSLDASFLNFRVGDRAYLLFLESIPDLDDNTEARPYPEVEFLPLELEGRFDAPLIAERLQALEDLVAYHDLALSDLAFDPVPTGEREGQIEIPFSATLDLSVIVVNRGNEPESDVTVRLRLIEGSDVVVDERSETIVALEPGEAIAVAFPDLAVRPGQFYEAVLTVDLQIDDDPTSNRLSQVFFRNDSA
ncbi:MAG: hypothetical protein OEM22_04485 [Acidimicrobiia bacterium]|nr:hypothetical protein [Acidimicrobiia bacterium]MDH3469866.1 hypothetical protein [Acidimicrobiia bacterium]